MRKILSGFWVLVALGFGGEASAVIVHVPGDHPTLQAAVDALLAGFTLRGGSVEQGGAIHLEARSAPTIED